MEVFESVDFDNSPKAIEVTVTCNSSEAAEAVNNLIYLSRHPSVLDSYCQKTMSHFGSSANTKAVTIIKSSFSDVFNGSKAYRCPLCTETDDNPSTIYTHIQSAHKGFTVQTIDQSQMSSYSYFPASSDVTHKSSAKGSSKEICVIKTSEADREKGVKRYHCSACGYNNEFTSNVYRHMRTKHNSSQIQRFSECVTQMPNNVNHLKTNLTTCKEVRVLKATKEDLLKRMKLYRCSACGLSSDTTGNLYRHMRRRHKDYSIRHIQTTDSSHYQTIDKSQMPSYSYSPVSSDVTYKSSANGSSKICVIKTSEADREKGVKRYQCSACGYNNDSTSNVYKHMRTKHSSSQIQRVSECVTQRRSNVNHPKTIFTSGTEVTVLKATEEEFHKGVKMYRCSACGLPSHTTGNLYKHMRRCHKDYSIKRISSYGKHKRAKKNAPKAQVRVVKIVRSSLEEIARGEKPYKCSECGISSKDAGNLYAHMETSHPECSIQNFKPPNQIDADNVVRPIKVIQDGKFFYKCSKCCLVSPSKSNVYRHMRRRHKNCTIFEKLVSRRRKGILSETYQNSSGGDNIVDNDNDLITDKRAVGSVSKDQQSVTAGDDGMVGIDGMNNEFVSYECSVCMRTFTNCNDLDGHVKIHGGDILNSLSDRDDYNEDSDFGMEEEDDGGFSDQEENGYLTQEPSASDKESSSDYGLGCGVDEEIATKKECRDSDGRGRRVIEKKIASEKECVDNDGQGIDMKENIASKKECSGNDEGVISDVHEQNASEKDGIVSVVVVGQRSSEIQNPGVVASFNTKQLSREGLSISDNIKNRKSGDLFVSDQCSKSTFLSTKPQRQCTIKTYERSRLENVYSQKDRSVTYIKTTKEENEKGVKNFKCSLCHWANNSISKVYRHMRHDHKGYTIQKNKKGLGVEDNKSKRDGSFGDRVVKVLVIPADQRQNGKLFSCSECGQEDKSTNNLYNHMHQNHKGFIIQRLIDKELDLTNDLEPDRSSISKRIARVLKVPLSQSEVGEKPFKCSECSFGGKVVGMVYHHIKVCHKGIFIGKMIDLNNDSSMQTNSHWEKSVWVARSSSFERKTGFKKHRCSLCDFSRDRATTVREHMKVSHPDYFIEKPAEIRKHYDLCHDGNDNSNGESVVYVVKIPNERGPYYKCSKCERTSKTTGNLYRHMRRTHKDCVIEKLMEPNKNYEHCVKDSSLDESVVRVINLPLSEKGQFYKCSKCSLISRHANTIRRHMRSFHSDLTILKKVRYNNKNMKRFLGLCDDIESNEKIDDSTLCVESFECSVCMKTFNSRSDLDKHTKVKHSSS